MPSTNPTPAEAPWRRRLYRIIFESETRSGRAFDIALLVAIGFSIVIVSLESVPEIRLAEGRVLVALEWTLTVLFTLEYIARLLAVRRPLAYALSFYGLVDLLAIVPTYLGLYFSGARSLLVIRALRLLRMFRILKLVQLTREAQVLLGALRASRTKIFVFLLVVATLIIISGTLMYLVEGRADSGFTSIPRSMYWAVVTMTTVGYGDIAPKTALGQFLAALLMISGYAIIAVPTGIVSAELVLAPRAGPARECPQCRGTGHSHEATYCMHCGAHL